MDREGFPAAPRLLRSHRSTAITNPTSSDRVIVRRLLDGDEAAFRDIFDAFFPRLYRYALARVGGRTEDARDIVQQTFCKAFERLDSYRGEASLYSWMCQICRNTLIDMARRQNLQVQRLSVADTDDAIQAIVETIRAPESDGPEQQLARMHLLRLIQTTLDYLPGHYGDVLEWKYIEECSVNDIAARLAIAPKAAESLLTRARGAFRKAITAISESADLLPPELRPTAKG
jgi:RNA polymerase sigma-70 factor (ECF subfamily)